MDKSRGRCKRRKDLKCCYFDKSSFIEKDYWKLKKGLKEKDNNQNNQDVNLVHDELVRVFDYGNECLMVNCDASWVINISASFMQL